nr:MAG TPA: hypothetical protein [Caudoviricetes sp.]
MSLIVTFIFFEFLMLIIVLALILQYKDTATFLIVQLFCVLFYIYFVISVTKEHNYYIINVLHIIFFLQKKRQRTKKSVFVSQKITAFLPN